MSAIRIVIEALEKHVDEIIVRLVFEITAILTSAPSRGGTPVDTGWARANWIVSVGRPEVLPVGSRKEVSIAEQQASLAALLGYKRTAGAVFIVNNVPYIRKLNEGWSKQAPAAFIQAAVAEGSKKILGK